MTPRIPPVTDPDEEQAALLGKTLFTPGAKPLNVFATLAHHPLLLKRVNALGGLFMAHGTLPARQREIVILRVALRVGSEYERAQHEVIAQRVGVPRTEVDQVAEASLDRWAPQDRILLQAADELCADDDLSEPTFAALSAALERSQVLELIMMVGFYRMLGGLLRTARVEVDAGA